MKRAVPILAAAVVILAGADILAGGGGFSLPRGILLWKLRIPRVLTAVLAGCALSLSGAQMQALFRNPLADPHIMGVSGGAALGAALASLAVGTGLWISGVSMVVAAFAAAFVTALLLVAVSSRVSGNTLLIFGVLLGFVFSALASILQFTAREESLKLFYSWMAGSFAGTRYLEIIIIGAALLAGVVMALVNARGLDVILFGEEYAGMVGARPQRIRTLSMISASLMTAAVTAFCGPVGFVGIVAPHLARRACASSVHASVLPVSCLCGAGLALAADILANVWAIPLPVGSTLALVGIPMIIAILLEPSCHPERSRGISSQK
jgi:iron complex transport system permease protein